MFCYKCGSELPDVSNISICAREELIRERKGSVITSFVEEEIKCQ